MYEKITKYILEQILPKYIQECISSAFYPVITGGTAVERCLGKKVFENAHLQESDIDLMIVVKDIDLQEEADRRRIVMLEKIVEDKDLIAIAEKEKVKVKLDRHLYKKKNYDQFYLKLVRLKIGNYHIMDTSIYTKGSIPSYNLYSKCFDKLEKEPIPFEWHHGVPYAICSYIYFDTLRMVIFYHDLLAIETKGMNKIVSKYIGYISKFITLYELMYKDNKKKPTDLYKSFDKLRSLLITTGALPDKSQISKQNKKMLLIALDVLNRGAGIDEYYKCIREQNDNIHL